MISQVDVEYSSIIHFSEGVNDPLSSQIEEI
jgi:hypothetical protein